MPSGVLKREVRRGQLAEARGRSGGRRCSSLITRPTSAPVSSVTTSDALALAERGLDRVGEAAVRSGLHHQPVDHELDVVLHLLVEGERLLERADLPVDARPGEAPLLRVRRGGPGARPSGSGPAGARSRSFVPAGSPEDLVHDLLRGLLADRAAAVAAVLHADGGVEHAQVVVDLGDGAHGRARVVARRLLLDGDGRREAADGVVLRLLHLPEELPGVGGERTRRSAAAPRRRGCRRRASSSRIRRPRVKTTSFFFGMSRETDLRLCSRAPRTEMTSGSDMRSGTC